MRSVIGLISIVTMMVAANLAVAAEPTAAGSGGAGHQASGDVSGVTIFGAYLMRHTVHADGAATAHFNPALPLDSYLITRAMQSLARIAYLQHGIEVADLDAVTPKIGSIIKLQDLDYEYRFILDGKPTQGISTILVRRSALPQPPAPDNIEPVKVPEKM